MPKQKESQIFGLIFKILTMSGVLLADIYFKIIKLFKKAKYIRENKILKEGKLFWIMSHSHRIQLAWIYLDTSLCKTTELSEM